MPPYIDLPDSFRSYSYPILLWTEGTHSLSPSSLSHSPLIQLRDSCFRSLETTEVMIPVSHILRKKERKRDSTASVPREQCNAFLPFGSWLLFRTERTGTSSQYTVYRLLQNLTPVKGLEYSFRPPLVPSSALISSPSSMLPYASPHMLLLLSVLSSLHPSLDNRFSPSPYYQRTKNSRSRFVR